MSYPRPPFDIGEPERPLTRLAACLGLRDDVWREGLDQIRTRPNLEIPAGKVMDCRRQLVDLIAVYGDCLDESFVDMLSVKIYLKPDLTVDHIKEAFEKDKREYESASKDSFALYAVRLFLKVDKGRLLRKYLNIPKGVVAKLIFFLPTLEKELQRPIRNLEAWWGQSRYAKVMIFLPAWRYLINGSYLAVIGGNPGIGLHRISDSEPAEIPTMEPIETQGRQEAANAGANEDRDRAGRFMELKSRPGRCWKVAKGIGQRIKRIFIPPLSIEEPAVKPDDERTYRIIDVAGNLDPKGIYDACRDSVNWQAKWLDFLTPLHLAVADRCPDYDSIIKPLRVHQVNLCMMFTADWTREAPAGRTLVAIFSRSTRRRKVKVTLADPRRAGAGISARSVQDLIRVAVGAYQRSSFIGLVQSAVAAALQDTESKDRYDLLTDRASELRDEIEARWKLFMEGELEEFMDQVQALEDYVADTVRTFSDQTSTMIKSLSDTMLAAVAVLLGSFVAMLASENFNPVILTIGVAVYLVYLVVFPLNYNMRQRQENYQALATQFDLRQRRFKERLYPKKVRGIVGEHVEKSKGRFERWFKWTVRAYWAVVGLFILIVVLVWMFHGELTTANSPWTACSSGPDPLERVVRRFSGPADRQTDTLVEF